MPRAVLCDSSMGKEGDPQCTQRAGREGASKYEFRPSGRCTALTVHSDLWLEDNGHGS